MRGFKIRAWREGVQVKYKPVRLCTPFRWQSFALIRNGHVLNRATSEKHKPEVGHRYQHTHAGKRSSSSRLSLSLSVSGELDRDEDISSWAVTFLIDLKAERLAGSQI